MIASLLDGLPKCRLLEIIIPEIRVTVGLKHLFWAMFSLHSKSRSLINVLSLRM